MDFYEKIYRESEYYDIVRNTIIYKVSKIGDFDLDDCISKVYEIALQKKELEKHPNIKGWLNLTAKNIAKRFIHEQFLAGMRITAIDVDKLESPNFIYENQAAERYKEISDILEKNLKRSEFKLFALKFTEQLPNAEIAALIGIKKHSAEQRITRLKEKIRKILNNI